MRSILLFVAACLAASCSVELPEGTFVCSTADDCPNGWSCDPTRNRCVRGEGDGGSCPDTQVASPSGCVDRDECADATNPCGEGNSCTNTDPGYSCSCAAGTTANATTCVDVDECAVAEDDCVWITSCANTYGSFDCACPDGFTSVDHDCTPSCSPMSDNDAGTLVVTFATLSVPDPGGFELAGFDLDGINNAPRTATATTGRGPTVEGCRAQDVVGGVDNTFGILQQSFVPAGIDFESDLDEAMTPPNGTTRVSFAKLAANAAADDPCVGVTLEIDGGTFTAVGAMNDHVVDARFTAPITFDFVPQVPSGACSGGTCTATPLPLRIEGAHARFVLDAGHTTVVGAVIGGWIFFRDTDDVAYEWRNNGGMYEALATWGAATGLEQQVTSLFQSAFQGAVDLRIPSDDDELIPCELVPNGEGQPVPNANAVSFAFSLSN